MHTQLHSTRYCQRRLCTRLHSYFEVRTTAKKAERAKKLREKRAVIPSSIERNNRKVRAVARMEQKNSNSEKNRFMCLKELMLETKVAFIMWLRLRGCKFCHWRLQNTIISRISSMYPVSQSYRSTPVHRKLNRVQKRWVHFATNHIAVVRAAADEREGSLGVHFYVSSLLRCCHFACGERRMLPSFSSAHILFIHHFCYCGFSLFTASQPHVMITIAEIIIVMLMSYASGWVRSVCAVRSDAS